MKDEKRNPRQESQNKKSRTLTSKRWFYPALYLCVVALIVSAVLWTQRGSENPNADSNQTDNDNVALNQGKDDSIPVNGAKEVFKWPVADKNAVQVVTPFYDVNGDPEDQVKALVTYDNTTTQNTGICLSANDGKAFDVEASMGGKVVKAAKDPILGYVVEIEHDNGVKTMYESLASIKVEKGQEVTQSQVIGTAGKSKYNASAGVHVHFEIRKDNQPVNPVSYFQKGLASLDNVKADGNDAQVTNGTPVPSDELMKNSEDSKSDNSPANSDSSDEDKTSTEDITGTSDDKSDNSTTKSDDSTDSTDSSSEDSTDSADSAE